MDARSQSSYCGILLKGLKYVSIGTFDPMASEHSVNKIHVVAHVVSWIIMEMSLLGGCTEAGSFDERVLSCALLASHTIYMSKFAMFSLNRNALYKFIKLIDLDAISRTQTDTYINKAIRDIVITLRSYGVVAVITGVAYMGGTLFFVKPQSQKTETISWEIFHVYLPCDVIVFERIGVARLIITILIFYHGYCQVFLDIVSVSLFTHVGWQFVATADLFKNIRYSDNHAEARVRLKEVIEYHQLILGYAENLQKMYSGVFLVQLVICCLQLCFCMVLFVNNMKTTEGSLADAISHVSLLAVLSFQLFLFTRSADLTEERALLVAEGVYSSAWHLATPSTRRDLTLVLMCAQRPIMYSAMGIFPMTAATFSQIMRSAYGAFSLMTSMD